jgi:hypothetical protein
MITSTIILCATLFVLFGASWFIVLYSDWHPVSVTINVPKMPKVVLLQSAKQVFV